MPADFFLALLVAALGLSGAATVALWPRVREWCENSLFPWLKDNLPQLAPHVRDAFAAVDDAATAVRRAARQAWQSLREYLLQQVVRLRRRSSSQWVRRITSWVVKMLRDDRPVPVKVVTEEVCAWDDLPDEVRSEWLRKGKNRHKINATELRDEELAVAC